MSASTDSGALNCEQQRRLRDWKIQTRISNEEYLRSHQEVKLLLSGFIRDVLLKRPENIREFAAAEGSGWLWYQCDVSQKTDAEVSPVVEILLSGLVDYFTDLTLRDKVQEKRRL